MNRKTLAIGFAIALCIALCITLVTMPVSAQAAKEFTGTAATATAEVTPAEEALEGTVIRVHFVDFTYTMPSGLRGPGPLSDQYYIVNMCGLFFGHKGEIQGGI